MAKKFKVSDEVKLQIVNDIVEPSYIEEIRNSITARKCWKKTGQIFETLSKVLVAVSGILSFSSGYFGDPILGLVSGSITTISLAMLQFSSFSYNQNKKQSAELNLLLQKINVDTIPIIERSSNSKLFIKPVTSPASKDNKPCINVNPSSREGSNNITIEKKNEISEIKTQLNKLSNDLIEITNMLKKNDMLNEIGTPSQDEIEEEKLFNIPKRRTNSPVNY
jgi:hypothetical protein